ncbi:MAG: hypothetical protein M1829_003754 [Trizodia sp. TS-e1964]|nr:MAG: hypothetical protein M1829_003754 [Trizodia sp. TS-e1964]
MSRPSPDLGSIIPAQLSFLAIYNPSLGNTDETLPDQILYYYSRDSKSTRRGYRPEDGSGAETKEELNERLRQVGLAQGMVEFAKSFSDGELINSVETEKSRIILQELETGWWILASIDLTRLTSSSKSSTNIAQKASETPLSVDYSAREVCPPALLLQHLLRAHSTFLLHHTSSLSELYGKVTRVEFCDQLERFWSQFIWNWDVLLQGNPAVDIFGGIKLAQGGELGIGVGEEERGSGEREVLEGFVNRIDGLVDLVVSRFGEPSRDLSWGAPGTPPGPNDGAIFLGVGYLSKKSVRDVAHWMEDLYRQGEDAYGILDIPKSSRRKKNPKHDGMDSQRRRGKGNQVGLVLKKPSPLKESVQQTKSPTKIPPPVFVTGAETPDQRPRSASAGPPNRIRQSPNMDGNSSGPGSNRFLNYLTLGYGSAWSLNYGASSKPPLQNREFSQNPRLSLPPRRRYSQSVSEEPLASRIPDEKLKGHFLIGLKGNVEEDDDINEGDGVDSVMPAISNTRIIIRTLWVEVDRSGLSGGEDGNGEDGSPRLPSSIIQHTTSDLLQAASMNGSSANSTEGGDDSKRKLLRIVVYVNQPFIFTFLFEPHTSSLASSSFYRSLHHQLGPLQGPLLTSTSWKSPQSILDKGKPPDPNQPIYTAIYDPSTLKIHSSIPPIPPPSSLSSLTPNASWSRVEALNVHFQILSTFVSSRSQGELERTCKTSRGWWVVWMRLPPAQHAGGEKGSYREAFLVRKSSDSVTAKQAAEPRAWPALGGKFIDSVGVDPRKYLESLGWA